MNEIVLTPKGRGMKEKHECSGESRKGGKRELNLSCYVNEFTSEASQNSLITRHKRLPLNIP